MHIFRICHILVVDWSVQYITLVLYEDFETEAVRDILVYIYIVAE